MLALLSTFNTVRYFAYSMRYIKPGKLKVMMIMFFSTGIFGIFFGLAESHLYVTSLGVINLCLGGLVGWLFLTQGPKPRKKKRP